MNPTYFPPPPQNLPKELLKYPNPSLDFSRVAPRLYDTKYYGGIHSTWISTMPESKIWSFLYRKEAIASPPLSQEEQAMLAEFTHFFLLEEYPNNPTLQKVAYSHIL